MSWGGGEAVQRAANQRCLAASFSRWEANDARGERLHFHVGFLQPPLPPPILPAGYKRHSGGRHLHGRIFLQQRDDLQKQMIGLWKGDPGGGWAPRRDETGRWRCVCGFSLP